jgi:hypothetical protein
VQPAQLSLLPDQVPALPPALIAQLPPARVAIAVTLLARLIAKASASDAVASRDTASGQVSSGE